MKNIQLQKLVISNFKGINSLDISFNHETSIMGANGTGKTTISDAFMWLLFGKNTEERKDFSIKPLTDDGSPAQKTENEVTGFFIVDGKPEVLKRIHREKWIKSRGELEATFQGNETLFFWNDVPYQAGEYAKKVSELVDEKLFKMITSPYAFAALNWTDKRSIITAISGEVSNEELAGSRKELQELLFELSGKSIEEYRKELAAKRKKLKDELDLIPARIDELQRSKPDTPDIDLIQIEINNIDNVITKCNDRIKDQSKASEAFFKEKTARNNRVYEIRTELSKSAEAEKNKLRSEYSGQITKRQELEREIRNIDQELKTAKATIENLNINIRSIDSFLAARRAEWVKVNESVLTFNENEFSCPTCKRAYESDDIEAKQAEMLANFNQKKASDLSAISQQGKAKNEEKTAILTQIKELEDSLEMLKDVLSSKMDELKSIEVTPSETEISIQAAKNIQNNPEQVKLGSELDKLIQLNDLPFSESSDTSATEAERKAHQDKRDTLNLKLKDVEVIAKTNTRIEELTVSMRDFAQQMADIEKKQFSVELFEKTKASLAEEKVNRMFSKLKFRMFKQNINGSIEPTCEILINGVPFVDANTASQINAGIEIINVLCAHYQVSAPIFVDNRESCTEIIPTESQLINLVVSPEHKSLTIK